MQEYHPTEISLSLSNIPAENFFRALFVLSGFSADKSNVTSVVLKRLPDIQTQILDVRGGNDTAKAKVNQHYWNTADLEKQLLNKEVLLITSVGDTQVFGATGILAEYGASKNGKGTRAVLTNYQLFDPANREQTLAKGNAILMDGIETLPIASASPDVRQRTESELIARIQTAPDLIGSIPPQIEVAGLEGGLHSKFLYSILIRSFSPSGEGGSIDITRQLRIKNPYTWDFSVKTLSYTEKYRPVMAELQRYGNDNDGSSKEMALRAAPAIMAAPPMQISSKAAGGTETMRFSGGGLIVPKLATTTLSDAAARVSVKVYFLGTLQMPGSGSSSDETMTYCDPVLYAESMKHAQLMPFSGKINVMTKGTAQELRIVARTSYNRWEHDDSFYLRLAGGELLRAGIRLINGSVKIDNEAKTVEMQYRVAFYSGLKTGFAAKIYLKAPQYYNSGRDGQLIEIGIVGKSSGVSALLEMGAVSEPQTPDPTSTQTATLSITADDSSANCTVTLGAKYKLVVE